MLKFWVILISEIIMIWTIPMYNKFDLRRDFEKLQKIRQTEEYWFYNGTCYSGTSVGKVSIIGEF